MNDERDSDVPFRVSDKVKILTGPFKEFEDIVDVVDSNARTVGIHVLMFSTQSKPAEFGFEDVALSQ